MKKYLLFIWISCHCVSPMAQKNAPKWIEKAKKAVITVETYDKNGNMRKGNGFFVQESGEAVSDYTLFVGAESAFVTDAEGRKMEVTRILGADELYDVIHFTVAVPKRVPFLPLANGMPAEGTEAYLLPGGVGKGEALPKGTVLEVTKIKETYGYYKIDAPLTATQVSIPLLTPEGEVFAMAQADASGKNRTYGVSVPYILSLRPGTMDLFHKTYASVGIRKTWPSTPDEAQIALMFYVSRQDAPAYLETLNDFIATFPDAPDGYLSRASHYAYHRKELAASEAEQMQSLSLAQADMQTAMKYTDQKSKHYFEQAKLIYGVATGDSTLLQSTDWGLDVALSYLRKAIAEEDIPAYRQLEGDIAFYLENYEQAYHSYLLATQSPSASPLAYYMAAKAGQLIAGVNLSEVIALLDSAVAKSEAVPGDALLYLQEGAELKMQLGQYAAAVKDYDLCYRLMAGNVTDAFYYYREQARFRAGDMEGALDDITSAIALDARNAVYHAEEASIYLRMQDPEKAQVCVEKALALDPDFASCYRLLGVSYLRRQKNDDACAAFHKAKTLGDPLVDKLIKDNCKDN
jgi:tetratricopeptide (TPR) repeat protein